MYPSIILFVVFLIKLKGLRSGCSVKVVVAEAGLVCSCLLLASVTSGSTAWKWVSCLREEETHEYFRLYGLDCGF